MGREVKAGESVLGEIVEATLRLGSEGWAVQSGACVARWQRAHKPSQDMRLFLLLFHSKNQLLPPQGVQTPG